MKRYALRDGKRGIDSGGGERSRAERPSKLAAQRGAAVARTAGV